MTAKRRVRVRATGPSVPRPHPSGALIVTSFAILLTGRHPRGLYDFGVGVLRWNTRV